MNERDTNRSATIAIGRKGLRARLALILQGVDTTSTPTKNTFLKLRNVHYTRMKNDDKRTTDVPRTTNSLVLD